MSAVQAPLASRRTDDATTTLPGAPLPPDRGAGDVRDDGVVSSFGYHQRFTRTLRSFGSFAVAFSFISITTGIFSTFGTALGSSGPRAIWTWPIAVVGQVFVALVYGALAARLPLTGYSYQWASRLANPHLGWWFGWVTMAFLAIVTVAVDYGLTQTALLPLLGMDFSPSTAVLVTLGLLVVQAVLVIWSTPITTRINNLAVGTEVLGIVGLTVALLVAVLVLRHPHWSNLSSTGTVPGSGYFGFLGPFMLATLLGAYAVVGFESASNLAEETHQPRRVIPWAMVRSIVVAGVLGMLFLIAVVLAAGNVRKLSTDSAPVATVIGQNLGAVPRALALVVVCVSIFACGLVVMVSNSRLIYGMARDGRLPGAKWLTAVPRATGGPLWSTVLTFAVSAGLVSAFGWAPGALTDLMGAATLLPALLYAGTVLLYQFTRHRLPARTGDFTLGRWDRPVVVLALLWLGYELLILIGPSQFRAAQYYTMGVFAVGGVLYLALRLVRPGMFHREQEQRPAS